MSEVFSPVRRRAFGVVNASSAPVFLAMVLAPRSRATARIVDRVMPLHVGLGAVYGVMLSGGMLDTRAVPDFRDPERLRDALGHPDLFLAGWTHYISFDLFVGQWIWRDALASGRSARLALLLTWLAGPLGLTLYLTQRGLSAARTGTPL